jgi:hypothetical protein
MITLTKDCKDILYEFRNGEVGYYGCLENLTNLYSYGLISLQVFDIAINQLISDFEYAKNHGWSNLYA